MPATTRTDLFCLDDGRALRMTVAEPHGVVRGGLVMLPDAAGAADPAASGLPARLAAEGWLVAVPHLKGAGTLPVELDSVLDDVDIAFGWLATHGITADRIGVLGFDFGGAIALMVAAERHIGAAVTVGGGAVLQPVSEGLPALVDVAAELRCPWLGIYGEHRAGESDEVEKLRGAAIGSGMATDVVLLADPDHRFDLHPDTAGEAAQRVFNWFDAHLR